MQGCEVISIVEARYELGCGDGSFLVGTGLGNGDLTGIIGLGAIKMSLDEESVDRGSCDLHFLALGGSGRRRLLLAQADIAFGMDFLQVFPPGKIEYDAARAGARHLSSC